MTDLPTKLSEADQKLHAEMVAKRNEAQDLQRKAQQILAQCQSWIQRVHHAYSLPTDGSVNVEDDGSISRTPTPEGPPPEVAPEQDATEPAPAGSVTSVRPLDTGETPTPQGP